MTVILIIVAAGFSFSFGRIYQAEQLMDELKNMSSSRSRILMVLKGFIEMALLTEKESIDVLHKNAGEMLETINNGSMGGHK